MSNLTNRNFMVLLNENRGESTHFFLTKKSAIEFAEWQSQFGDSHVYSGNWWFEQNDFFKPENGFATPSKSSGRTFFVVSFFEEEEEVN